MALVNIFFLSCRSFDVVAKDPEDGLTENFGDLLLALQGNNDPSINSTKAAAEEIQAAA
jgi:hypothetical protein